MGTDRNGVRRPDSKRSEVDVVVADAHRERFARVGARVRNISR